MPATENNKLKAQTLAAELGAAALAGVDLASRCADLGLAPPGPDGSVKVRVLGQDLILTPPEFAAIVGSSGKPAAMAERILAIHYLACAVPVKSAGQWISFRDFPGGQFYWGPFCSRTVAPLVKRIGNDLDLLRKNLDRFQWLPLDMPDLSASIQAVGAIHAALIYRRGDDELEPTAEILFDAAARRIFGAEDVAVLAGRICIGLL